MNLRVFWDKQQSCEYKGHIHIGPTSSTHCTSCDGGARPLAKGIGVHFVDEHGIEIFVTGPDCFKKHTDIKSLSQIPTIGFGFSDITTSRARSPAPAGLQGAFRTAVTGISAEQETAYANVMLRARILPAMGFQTKQPGLDRFLTERFPYSPEILQTITRYVDTGVSRFGRATLNQLTRAHYVAHQIEALKAKDLWRGERGFVENLDQSLKVRFGLTDRQMESLEQMAKKHGLLLQEAGIRFPENQSRLEASRAQPRLGFGETD